MRKFCKKTTAFALVVAMLLAGVPSLSFADEPADPKMILRMGSDYYTSGEEYTAEIMVYNVDFYVAGFSLGFDTAATKLADSAVEFNGYSGGKGIFDIVATDMNETDGRINAVFFVSPMATESPVIPSPTNENAKLASVGNDGLSLGKVKFVSLKDAPASVEFVKIADSVDFNDKAYVLSYNGKTPEDVTLSVEYETTPLADAEAFMETVEKIGEVTLEDENLIKSAYSEYEDLSDLSKKIADSAKTTLDDAKEAFDKLSAEMGDEEVAKKVIEDLKILSEMEPDNLGEMESAINTISSGYEALTDAQKEIVNKEVNAEEIISSAKKRYEEYLAAHALEKAIRAMQEIMSDEEITEEDKEKVTEAKALYDKLTDKQKAEIDPELVKALEDALEKIGGTEEEYVLGDVDGNKKVNALDATQILRFANNKSSVLSGVENTDVLFKAADVDGNGKINALDATQILRFANNKSSVLTK